MVTRTGAGGRDVIPLRGSLNNRLMEHQRPEMPAVGDAATLTGWTDRHGATVTSLTFCTVTVQRDKATRADSNGMSESQRWTFERDPAGDTYTFRRNRYGRYVNRKCGYGLVLGHRSEYFDYSF